jgi:hypothetical protein
LIVFELFTVNLAASSVYDERPARDQLPAQALPLVAAVPRDEWARVDGFRGLTDNYGSFYRVYDARGISPLFLDGLYQLQQPPFATSQNFETNPTFWELNAVKVVYSGFEVLPVPSTVIAQGADRFGTVYLHELTNPRPLAQWVFRADVVDSDAFARALLADPNYRPREAVILHTPPRQNAYPVQTTATTALKNFAPETITITLASDRGGFVTLAHPDYPGWQATLDGETLQLLRAYGGFTAIEAPPGEHTLTLVYRPHSFYTGAVISGVAWLWVLLAVALLLVRREHPDAIHT